MTPEQIKLVDVLAGHLCRNATGEMEPKAFFPAKFVAQVHAAAQRDPAHPLTDQQDAYLRKLAFDYRRQIDTGAVLRDSRKTFSTLQWLAPELAKKGLLKNESWVETNAAEAAALYSEKNLQTCASLLAALHPHALSYLQSAPVLVLAATHDEVLSKQAVRERITKEWLPRFQNGAKLRDLMQTCGLAFALRKLDGRTLQCRMLPVLTALGDLGSSTLAQAIPGTRADQTNWLAHMRGWHDTMSRRFTNPTLYLAWAAARFQPGSMRRDHVVDQALGGAGNLADFVGANPAQFNPAWTLRRALDAMNDWHERMAHADHDEKFFLQNGLQWEEIIDYGALPVERAVGPFAFRAPQSGKALYEDGREMHHCVGSYSRGVISGCSRIYSMVHVGTLKRVATLELARFDAPAHLRDYAPSPPPYTLRQIKGPCNAAVSDVCHRSAAEFLAIVNRLEGYKAPAETLAEVKVDLIVQQAARLEARPPAHHYAWGGLLRADEGPVA